MRNSNFEMLRIVAILCIVVMHSSSFVNPDDYNFLLLKLIGAIGNAGVSCFILISGYYGIRFRWEKIFEISISDNNILYCCYDCE